MPAMADPDPGAAWVEIELDVVVNRFFALGTDETDYISPEEVVPEALSTDGDCYGWRIVGPVDADRAEVLNNCFPEQPGPWVPYEEPDYDRIHNDWGGVMMELRGTLRCAVLWDSISELDENNSFSSNLMPMKAIGAGNIENPVVEIAGWV